MTIIGPDRPGLVESLATIVAEHRGNWVESRMSHLAGQFAGILRVEIAEVDAGALKGALAALESEGVRTIAFEAEEAVAASGDCVDLELFGQDRPGIVREIAHSLAEHGVNVEELQTECTSAPMSGERIFKAQARLRIPRDLSLDELRLQLEKIASDLMVDVRLD
jgi:glycine cleavage system regulatory protein